MRSDRRCHKDMIDVVEQDYAVVIKEGVARWVPHAGEARVA